MNETEDIVYRCKDCSKYSLCRYYYRRKETSQICHYFELQGKKGKWKKISPAGIYECSECKQDVMTCDIDVYHFCHRCGAKMEVDDEIHS